MRQTTGMSRRTIVQIERARFAMDLLRHGTTILDTVAEAGFYDQAHLCRALKRWTGQTPTEHMTAPGSG
jgi:AraC-like DNA-binding protein